MLEYRQLTFLQDHTSAKPVERALHSFRVSKHTRMSSTGLKIDCFHIVLTERASSKAKPHICGIGTCTKAFGDPSSRTRHRKETHRREGAYKCIITDCATRSVCPLKSSF